MVSRNTSCSKKQVTQRGQAFASIPVSFLVKFQVALEISFLCLWLSMLPMGNAWGQEMERTLRVSSFQKPNRNYCGSERTARASQRIGSQAVSNLVKTLQNRDTKLRADAAHLLGSIDKKVASKVIPNLITASKNDLDAEVRVCAVSALISIAGKDLNKSTPEVKAVTPVVIAALKDSDTEVRLTALMAFQSMSFTYSSDDNFNVKLTNELKATIPVLMETLKDDNEQVRSNATSALSNMAKDTTSLFPVIIQALKDKNDLVRISAASILGRVGIWERKSEEVVKAVPVLITALKEDKNAKVRSNAAYALKFIGEKAATAVPALIEALKNDLDFQVRSSAASALESMGEKAATAVPVLIEALKKLELKYNAEEALGRIAESWQDNATKLSNQEVDLAISYLETALNIAENPKSEYANLFGFAEGKKRLRRSLNFLKKEKDSRLFSKSRPR
ncbi:HEAT repeat domain-containing protein [Nostoc sp. DedQUE09]|uniref:HEAT repeat domain-containing protein n=1 Tax=Nostoc sp. DedQUE09 TaxID=3075394 RepID=UPI002AD36A7F|nr:HEAT repeat domain-containing protein [Nostoc sp. DedQUE09]MDZ7951898.1 HEAT repeat domain-containing protein [Nostoc sp. DedQUE09]